MWTLIGASIPGLAVINLASALFANYHGCFLHNVTIIIQPQLVN
jgi:hypothetical protein